MKLYPAVLILSIVPILAKADQPIYMNNGMTCWQASDGYTYGCSGGSDNGSHGFNNVETGRRYEYTAPGQATDTRTGQPIDTPYRHRHQTDSDPRDE